METGALPQGVTEQDIPRYTQQVQADREMLNKFSALGEKFPDMSLAKKKAALGDAVMVLNQYRTDQQNEVRDAAARQQLALGALQLATAQREATAAPFFTQALGEVMSMQPGRAPAVPYQDVTQEMLGKYGDKLTPTQMQALIPMMRRIGQAIPAGMTALGATVGPEGTKVEYGLPPTVTSMPVPGTDYVQPMISGKAAGAPIKAQPQVQAEIDKLPEAQQKWANDTLSEVNKNPQIKAVGEQFKNLAEIKELGTTPSDDIALIFKYMKTLDPNSVVRETEFQTVGNAGGLPTQIQNIYNSYTTGNKLTPEIRRDIKKSADSVVRGSLKSVESTISDFVNQAKYRGVPEKLILPETSLKAWRSLSAQSTAESLQRFQSPEDMRARGIKRGLVFNPATGKYQEFQD
jgi:mRNA-degrading endonuclease RelE of RelBE toxin-antitoxin system